MSPIVRFDPTRNLLAWPRWLDDFEDQGAQRGLKIHETDKTIIAEAVVAGVPARDVAVEIEDGILTIKAEVKKEEKEEDRITSTSYQYYYTSALSGGQWEKAEAEVKDGVVKVTIPKTEAARPRKITVKTKEGQ